MRDYLPGLAAETFLPAGAPRRALVILLVPGGGWLTADPTGLRPLAADLAAHGAVAVTMTYRTGNAGAHFPEPVREVECAAAYAVWRAGSAGIRPVGVVLLGHSAGANLAALAALSGRRWYARCPYPYAPVTGLVGLSGLYDIRRAPDIAFPLLGAPPAERPAAWRAADPLNWVRDPASRALPVLLAHGSADTDVAVSFTQQFAGALRAAGHRVAVRIISGATHATVYRDDVVGPLVRPWLRTYFPDGVSRAGGPSRARPAPGPGPTR